MSLGNELVEPVGEFVVAVGSNAPAAVAASAARAWASTRWLASTATWPATVRKLGQCSHTFALGQFGCRSLLKRVVVGACNALKKLLSPNASESGEKIDSLAPTGVPAYLALMLAIKLR